MAGLRISSLPDTTLRYYDNSQLLETRKNAHPQRRSIRGRAGCRVGSLRRSHRRIFLQTEEAFELRHIAPGLTTGEFTPVYFNFGLSAVPMHPHVPNFARYLTDPNPRTACFASKAVFVEPRQSRRCGFWIRLTHHSLPYRANKPRSIKSPLPPQSMSPPFPSFLYKPRSIKSPLPPQSMSPPFPSFLRPFIHHYRIA